MPRRRRHALAMTVALAMALVSSGCSFIQVQGPPRDVSRAKVVTCTTSRVAPAVDLVGAPVLVSGAFTAALMFAFGNNANRDAAGVLITTASVTGLVMVVSGLWGLNRTYACREAKALVAQRTIAPPPLSPAEQAREKAEALQRIALDAARKGDCATVVHLDGEVRALDAEFHARGFVDDPAIAACLAR